MKKGKGEEGKERWMNGRKRKEGRKDEAPLLYKASLGSVDRCVIFCLSAEAVNQHTHRHTQTEMHT